MILAKQEMILYSGNAEAIINQLNKIKPKTLGQASRVSGITPADIAVLTIWVTKNKL